LKVALYPPIREPRKPHPTFGGSDSQVMSVGEKSPIRTLAVYEATRRDQDEVFDVDLRDDIIDKGPKPIKELVKLQLGPKPG